jgi:heme-degrading monooxygenase HmoA
MFLFQELRHVPEQRQTEALDRQYWIHGLMAQHPGFQRAIACRYAGATDRYAWFRFWDSDADQVSFRRSPAADYSASRPVGLYEPLPNAIAGTARWECELQEGVPGEGAFCVRSVYRVPTGEELAFWQLRRRHDEIASGCKGIYWLASFRPLDAASAGLFISLLRASDREAYNAFLESSAMSAYRQHLSETGCETLAVECYEVVHEVIRAPTP